MATGLLVIDVQPAYAEYCDFVVKKVVQRINNTVKPVTIMWVGEDLTEDTEDSVREYLREHGARPGRLAQASFVEKGYAFFRGWMDNGVDDEHIIMVGTHMHQRRIRCSDAVDLNEVFSGEVPDLPDADVLHWPSFDDRGMQAFDAFETCGGGAQQCLAEMELWLQMVGKPFKRLDALVY